MTGLFWTYRNSQSSRAKLDFVNPELSSGSTTRQARSTLEEACLYVSDEAQIPSDETLRNSAYDARERLTRERQGLIRTTETNLPLL